MGRKREIYTRLMTKPIRESRVKYLMDALREISSGTHSFGHQDEWDQWFRYLLPELVLRGHETYAFDRLLEHTITAFMQVYWETLDVEYPGFRQDALDSVPISLMGPELWSANPETPKDATKSTPAFLLQEHNGRLFIEWWGLQRARPDLSAALFFCLKYLPSAKMRSWVDSLLSIEHPHWKAAFLVWLAGAQPLLTADTPIPSMLESTPSIGWEHSYALGAPMPSPGGKYPPAEGYNENTRFLDSGSTRAFWEEIRTSLGSGLLAKWETELWSDERLSRIRGLADMLDRLGQSITA